MFDSMEEKGIWISLLERPSNSSNTEICLPLLYPTKDHAIINLLEFKMLLNFVGFSSHQTKVSIPLTF